MYKTQSFTADVDAQQALGETALQEGFPPQATANPKGIDHGVDNWLTCLSTEGKSFIIDGRKVKSLNQQYNKRVATLKEGKAQGFWSDELAAITEKRNRQMRDAINKAARFIINRCLADRIGTIIFGWNQGNKDGINIGKKNNQEFVQIPTAKLKDRITQLCKQYGLRFVETEESYTSKSSFLDDDFLPTYGGEILASALGIHRVLGAGIHRALGAGIHFPRRKRSRHRKHAPRSEAATQRAAGWKPSGKRGEKQKGVRHNLGRGGYQTADGSRINSDCNGAVNIIRKVMTQLDIGLAKVTRAALNLPKRYDLFRSLTKSYRKRCEVGLLDPVATSA